MTSDLASGRQPDVPPLQSRPTCFEDLVSYGEARPVGLVVGHELDEELPVAGDDGGGRDLPAELPQHGRALVPAVVHLHVVVPAGDTGRRSEAAPQVPKPDGPVIDSHINVSRRIIKRGVPSLFNGCLLESAQMTSARTSNRFGWV